MNLRHATVIALVSLWIAACSTSATTPGTGTCCEFTYGNATTCSCSLDGGTSACVGSTLVGVPVTAAFVSSCPVNPLAKFEPEAGPLPDSCIALGVCCTSAGASNTEGCVAMARSGDLSSDECFALIGELIATGGCPVDASAIP